MTFRTKRILACALMGAASLVAMQIDFAAAQPAADAQMGSGDEIGTVYVTARLRKEDAQKVPVAISVVNAETMAKTSTVNTLQIQQLIPSLNYSSPNPRNTAFTIRGLGSSVVAIAQANDGLEPGVGFYVDQVYQARPASAAFDFIDVERVEVLRGPQGTLFGKNTTAGAINIISKQPTFEPEGGLEVTGGNYGFVQSKGFFSGPIIDNLLAARFSGMVTERDGVIKSVTRGGYDNTLGDFGLRGQLLYTPSDNFRLRLTTDYSYFDSTCCTQVFVRVGTSLKPAATQYPALAAGLGYNPPSRNPYDRTTDIDADLGVQTGTGGVSAIADWEMDDFTLTSVSAWRFWDWDAANDRDYTSIPIQTTQHIPSRQTQISQELRIASNGENTVDYVAGLYGFWQVLKGNPITIYGPQAAYWLLGPPPATPTNLLDGYGTFGKTRFTSNSYAMFGELTWHVTDALSISPGMRYTLEDKDGTYTATVSGGPPNLSAALVTRQLTILRPQSYVAHVADDSPSGRVSISYQLTDTIMPYFTYARGFKSGGINMSGLPLNPANLPALSAAVVKPEQNTTMELGLKTRLFNRLTLNVDAFDTSVHDFQANVVDTGPGALRGYLANIEEVSVRGVELDSALTLDENFSAHLSSTYSDGKYVSYANGPCPLELIAAATTVCNLSGRPMSNLPRWVVSLGGEYSLPTNLFGLESRAYVHVETTYRSKVFGDPSDSKYTVIPGYGIVNLSTGFESDHWSGFFWVKNLLGQNYIQNLTVQAGNSGLIVGSPSDPTMFGFTLRATY